MRRPTPDEKLAGVDGDSREPMCLPIAQFEDRAIDDGFPFEAISEIAEAESWRKEIYRPVYHMHKWWAQRLGSVFRAAIIAAAVPEGAAVLEHFLEPVSLEGVTVFDPFMGSGTTVGEAHKLGCTAIGRDINPVAYRSVCTALGPLDRRDLARRFEELRQTAAPKLQRLYRSVDGRGQECDVLYYFWVKSLEAAAFSEKLRAVFAECHRVLRDGGRLIFSYHHSREDGWSAIAAAVLGAGFRLVQSQPVKSEMSVAAPKSQAKEPIDLDVLLVCKKRTDDKRKIKVAQAAFDQAVQIAAEKVERFNRWQRRLSRNDVRVVLLSQLLVELSAGRDAQQLQSELPGLLPSANAHVERIWGGQQILAAPSDEGRDSGATQLRELVSVLRL